LSVEKDKHCNLCAIVSFSCSKKMEASYRKRMQVFYHKGCSDSTCCNWIFKKSGRIGTETPLAAGKDLPQGDYSGLEVYIFDMCFSSDELKSLTSQAKKVVVIDHHDGNTKKMDLKADNLEVIFDSRKCAAQLVWKYFNEDVKEPWFIDVIAQRDLFKFRSEKDRALSDAIFNLNLINDEGFDKNDEFYR
jgi:hypothetical protein